MCTSLTGYVTEGEEDGLIGLLSSRPSGQDKGHEGESVCFYT